MFRFNNVTCFSRCFHLLQIRFSKKHDPFNVSDALLKACGEVNHKYVVNLLSCDYCHISARCYPRSPIKKLFYHKSLTLVQSYQWVWSPQGKFARKDIYPRGTMVLFVRSDADAPRCFSQSVIRMFALTGKKKKKCSQSMCIYAPLNTVPIRLK